nr:ribonuclease H-like domain-containing protein [Tanacetum cinerariifolium]
IEISQELFKFGYSYYQDFCTKQDTLSKSSTKAEYIALALVTSEVIWILKILKDRIIDNLLPIDLHCDSNPAIKIASNLVFHERTKHLEIDSHFVREKILSGVVKTVKVDTANQIADILTKGLDTVQHQFLVKKLGIIDVYQVETKGGVKMYSLYLMRRSRIIWLQLKTNVLLLTGDHLSPILFILGKEGLHLLTCKAEKLGLFKGAPFGHGVCVSDENVFNMAKDIGCGAAIFPMMYLGVPVGCNMSRCFNWSAIIQKFSSKLALWKARLLSHVKQKGIDLFSFLCSKKRHCSIANRLSLHGWCSILRRYPRGGAELCQFYALKAKIGNAVLTDQCDSWQWLLDTSAGFSVASIRSLIDSNTLDTNSNATHWNRCIPLKVNVDVKTSNHIFFSCDMATDLWAKLARYWTGPMDRFYTKSSEKMNSCTIRDKPLVLPWGRTPRLDSGVRKAFDVFCEKFHIPPEVHPVLTNQGDTMQERPAGKIGLYTRFFDFANFRLPLSTFLVNILSRHYTLDEETYPLFLDRDGEDMDIFAFIHTPDPTKVKVVERERKDDEPQLLETTVGRTVPLLPIAPDRNESEMDASPVTETIDTIAVNVIPLQPRRQKKRKIAAAEVGGSSHPPKKFREDHRTPSGPPIAGKSRSAVQSEPQRFVISSDSSHHSGANVTEAETDSLVSSSVPVMITFTTKTPTADPVVIMKEKTVKPSMFASDSSFVGGADPDAGVFSDLTRSDFILSGIRTVISPDTNLQKHGQLFTEFNVGAARQMSLSAKVRMRAGDEEIKNLKAHMLLKEAEAAKAIRLCAEAFNFKAVEKSFRDEVNALDVKVTDLEVVVVSKECELTDFNAQLTSIKSQNDNLADQVHELQVSYFGLKEKLANYENLTERLEGFQDAQLKVVNDKFDKLCTDFVEMTLHLKKMFYPHLLNTIARRRWLLTYGMELAIVKFLNSPLYLSALGTTISKAIEKGMQDGLAAGITHGKEGQFLIDVTAYNPSVEMNYVSALQQLQEHIAEILGLNESQPHVDQLMVPVHHSPKKSLLVLPPSQLLWMFLIPGSRGIGKTLRAAGRSYMVSSFLWSNLLRAALTDIDGTSDTTLGAGAESQAIADGNADPFANVDVDLNVLQ